MADWVLRCCDSGWLRLYSMALEVRLYIDAIIPPSKLCLGRSHSLSLENACVCVGACLSHKHLYTTHARKCLPLPLLLPLHPSLSLSLSLCPTQAHTLSNTNISILEVARVSPANEWAWALQRSPAEDFSNSRKTAAEAKNYVEIYSSVFWQNGFWTCSSNDVTPIKEPIKS